MGSSHQIKCTGESVQTLSLVDNNASHVLRANLQLSSKSTGVHRPAYIRSEREYVAFAVKTLARLSANNPGRRSCQNLDTCKEWNEPKVKYLLKFQQA